METNMIVFYNDTAEGKCEQKQSNSFEVEEK